MPYRCPHCEKKIDISSEFCMYCGARNKADGSRSDSDKIVIMPESMVRYRRQAGLFGGNEEYTDFSEIDYRFVDPALKVVKSDRVVVLTYEETEKE